MSDTRRHAGVCRMGCSRFEDGTSGGRTVMRCRGIDGCSWSRDKGGYDVEDVFELRAVPRFCPYRELHETCERVREL